MFDKTVKHVLHQQNASCWRFVAVSAVVSVLLVEWFCSVASWSFDAALHVGLSSCGAAPSAFRIFEIKRNCWMIAFFFVE